MVCKIIAKWRPFDAGARTALALPARWRPKHGLRRGVQDVRIGRQVIAQARAGRTHCRTNKPRYDILVRLLIAA